MADRRASGLTRLHQELCWPSPEDVLSAREHGVYERLVKGKIGSALKRRLGADMVEVGVLVPDFCSQGVEAPIAVVCDFARGATEETLHEAHRLAWNFCHAPLLITVDPYRIRAWSCFVAPEAIMGSMSSSSSELIDVQWDISSDASLPDQAARSLHWVALLAGTVFKDHGPRFKPEGRADRLLLANLKAVRTKLLSETPKISVDLAHDLIARLMFVQFLFDRKDASGTSALNPDRLAELHAYEVLRSSHRDLASLLRDYQDAYGFFRWLNDRFNGDLFPAKSPEPEKREEEWQREMAQVRPSHLAALADLVSGELTLATGQMSLWRQYSFDALPLEFVSSIYEEFVSTSDPTKEGTASPTGAYYTPAHLVDFVLDGVLPWDGDQWDIRILDPACGSGVFLVRAFQRLVHRWRRNHPAENIPVATVVQLLTENIYGLDVNPQATRVASFSLYLAMCDEIDPRRYWSDVSFPTLREVRIVTGDFFAEGRAEFDDGPEGVRYDLVVGNAPWGKKTASDAALVWAAEHEWGMGRKDIGVLFLAKSLRLAKPDGRVAMFQSAGTLLTNATSAAVRVKLFEQGRVDEIVNFTITRRRLFPSAESPACLLTMTARPPDGSAIVYATPKLLFTEEDGFRVALDDLDVHEVLPSEVADPWVWTVLMTGSRRDLELLRKIKAAGVTLGYYVAEGDIDAQEGVIPSKNGKVHSQLNDRRVLFSEDFPDGTFLCLDPASLPLQHEVRVHRVTNPNVFATPQLIVKQGWRKDTKRFRATVVVGKEGIVCSQSYVSGTAKTETGRLALHSACLALNSRMATYYLALTTGRMAYRPELRVKDVLDLPFRIETAKNFAAVPDLRILDTLTEAAFDLRDVDISLIEDAISYSVPELVREKGSPGRKPTRREADGKVDGTLGVFCDLFLRALGGKDGRRHSATIFEEVGDKLPIRIVAIHFGSLDKKRRLTVESIRADRLQTLVLALASGSSGARQISSHRTLTAFDVVVTSDGSRVPTAYFVRPDQVRFWTRSAALQEADRTLAASLKRVGLARAAVDLSGSDRTRLVD